MKMIVGNIILIGTPEELRSFYEMVESEEQFENEIDGEVRQWSTIKIVDSNVQWVKRNKEYIVEYCDAVEECFIVDDDGDNYYLGDDISFTYMVIRY